MMCVAPPQFQRSRRPDCRGHRPLVVWSFDDSAINRGWLGANVVPAGRCQSQDLSCPPMPIRLFTYKLKHDTGFAPNPFHGVCTLATCKPLIRRHKMVGDWIAGFTSTKLNGDAVGFERLVYLMRVNEKIALAEYHSDPRFASKIPRPDSGRCAETVGDNIYSFQGGVFVQLPNRSHGVGHMAQDLSGDNALVASTFAYFGSEPLVIPEEARPRVPKGQAGHGVRTEDPARARLFVDFVMAHGSGVQARPTSWRRDDMSWRANS